MPIIVDSGTTLSLLPKGVVAALAAQFSGAKSDNKGGYTVPCEHQARDGSVVFAFGPGVSISVAYRDFIWRSGSNCFLGAWYTPDVGVYILGDSFLGGVYGELGPPPPSRRKVFKNVFCKSLISNHHTNFCHPTQSRSTKITTPSTCRTTPPAILAPT